MIDLKVKLLDKSIEAFMMAIEIYNKPSIQYRVEGFAIFICNAWELMLKAYILKRDGNRHIYFKDKPGRTISLINCIEKVFTNNKDPLRINLEKIIELRDQSTHLITEEYEMVYVPLFQSCILNFNEKMKKFHNIDMTDYIPQNFLTLSVSMKTLKGSEIIAKYPEEIATKLLEYKAKIDDLSFVNNEKFAIRIDHYHFLTKDSSKATSFVKVEHAAETPVKIIKELQDPNNTHKYSAKKCIEQIRQALNKDKIVLLYKGNITKFNNFHFTNFCNYFAIKGNPKFCYIHKQYLNPQYSYSQQAIDFIVEEIKKDPENILDNIKNKSTPGAKEF